MEECFLNAVRNRGPIKIKGQKDLEVVALSQLFTHDHGRMDVVVFDKLALALPSNWSVRNPGRPVTLIEGKTDLAINFVSGFNQNFDYTRTLMGHHAGLGAMTLLLLSQSSFYVGLVYWNGYGELKAIACTKMFSLISAAQTGNSRVLTDKERFSWSLLHYLLFHPAVVRPRVFRIDRYPPQPIPFTTPEPPIDILLVHCVAVGSSTAEYLATTDLSRTVPATSRDGRTTDLFEGSASRSLDLLAKLFRLDPAYSRELHILGGLQKIKEDFGPRIIGNSGKDLCILYKRLDVAEYGLFYNDRMTRLNATHFSSLLEQVLFMHDHGIIHQDIRAANVGFRKERPVLLDFAFATILPGSPLANLKIPFRYHPEGYYGTRETASNRIVDVLACKRTATIEVTKKDDLLSLFKLYCIIQYGYGFYSGAKNWKDFQFAWRNTPYLKDLEKMPEKNLIDFLKYLFDDSNEGILPLFLDNQGRKVPYARHLYGKAKTVVGAVVVVDLISRVEEADEIINKDEEYLDDITIGMN